jgi:hypothetical protein
MGFSLVLHERDDFLDLLTTVGESTGAGASLVEKDYWVTEALRVVATGFGDGAVFKGGTSLSKAWGLIQRFSEDIDLLIRTDLDELESRGACDRFMKEIDAAVAEVPGLERVDGGRSERGISRTAVYTYEPRAPALEGLEATIILEMGIRGGPHPTARRWLRSMLAEALEGTSLEDVSIEPFEMTVLEARRTLVEKLFAIHCACELWSEGRTTAIRRQTRHLSDINSLLADPAIAEFVGSEEYHALIPEIDQFGRTYFERDHRTPAGLRFADSRALAPSEDLRAALEAEYTSSRFLFYGDFPSLDLIYARIDELRERL